MSITIADLKVRDVIITTEVEGGEYGLYTVLSMDDGAGIAILKPAGFSRARCVLTACESEEGAPRFTLSQVVTWGELSPCERDGESFKPEAVVEIVRAFPDGAVYETKDYFDALVRARKSLALPKGVSAFRERCDVAPLNDGRNNPHVIRLGDAERVYENIVGEHELWVGLLDMNGESVASAICLLSRDESEAVQKYADGAAEEVDLSEVKFIQLRSEALGGGSVIGCFIGDIVTVETASGVQYLQVTGGSDSYEVVAYPELAVVDAFDNELVNIYVDSETPEALQYFIIAGTKGNLYIKDYTLDVDEEAKTGTLKFHELHQGNPLEIDPEDVEEVNLHFTPNTHYSSLGDLEVWKKYPYSSASLACYAEEGEIVYIISLDGGHETYGKGARMVAKVDGDPERVKRVARRFE